MGRFAEAEAPPKARTSGGIEGCAVSQLLASPLIDDDDRAAIRGHLANLRLSDRAVAEWLTHLGAEDITGWAVTQPMLLRHRSGRCCGGVGKVR